MTKQKKTYNKEEIKKLLENYVKIDVNDITNADLNKHINYLIVSFTSDWLFPTKENLQIVEILNRNTCKVSYTEIETDKGHDSFLLDEPALNKAIMGFLNSNFNNTLEDNK